MYPRRRAERSHGEIDPCYCACSQPVSPPGATRATSPTHMPRKEILWEPLDSGEGLDGQWMRWGLPRPSPPHFFPCAPNAITHPPQGTVEPRQRVRARQACICGVSNGCDTTDHTPLKIRGWSPRTNGKAPVAGEEDSRKDFVARG